MPTEIFDISLPVESREQQRVSTEERLRDRTILAVLLGCGSRHSEVAALTFGPFSQTSSTDGFPA